MTEQSTSRTKQYWNYTIPERVKYATGDYFTTLKDDPHHPGFTDAEVELCYAAGIQWGDALVPVWKNIAALEALQMLMSMCTMAEYKGSVIDFKMLENRNLKLFGLNANELLRSLFGNLSDDLFNQSFEEFYWYMELTSLRSSGKSDGLQGLLYKAIATNIDNYLILRNADGLTSWAMTAALCCNTDRKITELPEWHHECVVVCMWILDAVNSAKHRAEGEACDLSRYIDDGMSESVSNMLEYARQKIWHLNKKYGKEISYQIYRVHMQGYFVMGYLMYRYRHSEFLGPVLAKSTKEDSNAVSNGKYGWYEVKQDGGVVGIVNKYREAVETSDIAEIEAALNRNYDLRAKQLMRKVLSEDMRKYNEIDFPVAKGKHMKI